MNSEIATDSGGRYHTPPDQVAIADGDNWRDLIAQAQSVFEHPELARPGAEVFGNKTLGFAFSKPGNTLYHIDSSEHEVEGQTRSYVTVISELGGVMIDELSGPVFLDLDEALPQPQPGDERQIVFAALDGLIASRLSFR